MLKTHLNAIVFCLFLGLLDKLPLAVITIRCKLIISLLIILVGTISFFSYRYLTLPDKTQIQKDWRYTISETASKNRYDSQVQKDQERERSFLLGKTFYAVCYSLNFPFKRNKINQSDTDSIIEILNDSSSYDWGEVGTPDYDYCIVFYNNEDNEIGYTEIEPTGEADSYPYISLMKWGMLKPGRFEQLMTIVKNAS